MMMSTLPTPGNPKVQRLGKVERRWRAFAKDSGADPGALLEKVISEGATQTQLAATLRCTRQAVAVMARRYGLEFPGARLDLDEAARAHGCASFEAYMDLKWGEVMTQEQMAEELDVSLSTLKRRIRQISEEREQAGS